MKLLALALVLGLSCSFVAGEKKRYDGYKVYRVFATNEKQFKLLNGLQNSIDLDFWAEPVPGVSPADIMVAPAQQETFAKLMNSNGMGAQIFIDDVQALIDQEAMDYSGRAAMDWTQYHTVDAIHAWLEELATLYPGKVAVVNAGKSYENREIKGVRINYGSGKRVVIIEAGIHAREWIGPATATYFINELLTTTNPALKRISDSFEWHIFPSTNPDGYSFSITSTRLWRKTRTPYGTCYGADPNRNFDFTWGVHGSSTNICSDTYRGPAPFSEKETQVIRQIVDSLASRTDVYLAMHSYGQYLLIPYGNSTAHIGNYDDLYKIGTKAASALAERYGTRYRVGNTAEILYSASGTSSDWVKDKYNVGISYTYEFRDTGTTGFVLPPAQILPNCLEVVDSLIALFEEGERLGYVNLVSASAGEPLYV